MKFVQILLFFLLLSACAKNNNCKNKTALIAPEPEVPTLQLNYNQSPEELIKTIEKLFPADICWQEKNVGLVLDHQVIKTTFLKMCLDGTILHQARSKVYLLLNQAGEVLLNQERIPIDAIEDWIANNFTKDLTVGKDEIVFTWTQATPKAQIEKVFQQLTNGYLRVYDQLAQQEFGKAVCTLEKKELNDLSAMLGFRIKLGFGGTHLPPPPPPSPSNE